MRQIALDTETTGINPALGHRIIEIGCVELIDRQLTGKHFHFYLNPDREVEEAAFRVHGLSNQFLSDKPRFKEIVSDFVDFIQGAELIIHNAPFDLGFLNMELKRLRWPHQMDKLCTVLDTLVLSKEKSPGQRHSLDALCKRYDVDNSNRKLHGALLDAEILASVYLSMTGGQKVLFDDCTEFISFQTGKTQEIRSNEAYTSPVIYATSDELLAHEHFMAFIEKNKEA